jgi:hypothetical protein
LRSIAYTNQVIAGARSAITRAKENIITKSDGYIPNFNAVMGYGIEKNNVMNSSQYTPSQKMRARPMRKIVNGQSTWMNNQESLVRNFMGSGKDAVLTPKMMGMAAEGYVPNFSPKYRYGSMGLQELMYQMQIARRGKVSQSHRDNLARAYRTTRRGVRAHGGMLAGGYNTAFQNIWNPQYMGGRRSHPIRALGGGNDFHLTRRTFRGNETNLLGAGRYTPDHMGRMINRQIPRGYSYQHQLGIEANKYNYGRGSSWQTSASRGMPAQGPGRFRGAFRQGGAFLRNMSPVSFGPASMGGGYQITGDDRRAFDAIKGQFSRGEISYRQFAKQAKAINSGSPLSSMTTGAPRSPSFFGRNFPTFSKYGKSVGGFVAKKALVPLGLALDAYTIGQAGMEFGGMVKAKRDRNRHLRMNLSSQRSSNTYFDLVDQIKEQVRTGQLSRSEGERRRKAAYNKLIKGRRELLGNYSEGYIPNFARGTNLAGLFSGYSKFHHQERSRYLGMSARYGAPGLGWLNHPSLSSRAMQTPGLRREMLRRSGITGGEQFRSYPTMGKFASEGIINSQMRERRQSGMNDVYTKFVNTPRYKGLATFNGSERGMEEMVVNSHPNPSRAGYAAEGQVPNFASLTKRLESVSESIGALNENMSSMAAPQATSESAQGSVSLSMQPMNININHSGNLTTQMSEVQNQLVAALDGAISSSMPGVYNALKGPPTT